MARIQQIRQKIIDRAYFISSHAEDEMLDDGLERSDVENAILKDRIQKKLTEECAERRTASKGRQGTAV
jgi:hypothetical protein